jgi:hypothetical protein
MLATYLPTYLPACMPRSKPPQKFLVQEYVCSCILVIHIILPVQSREHNDVVAFWHSMFLVPDYRIVRSALWDAVSYDSKRAAPNAIRLLEMLRLLSIHSMLFYFLGHLGAVAWQYI